MATISSNPLEATARAGVAAWQRGDAAAARTAFETVVNAGSATPQLWLLLAQSCEALHDDRASEHALDQLLAADPRNLYGLSMKGDLYTRRGDDRAATSHYTLALANAPAGSQFPADLIARLQRAEAAVAAANARFKAHLDAALTSPPATRPRRFAEALSILTGEAQVYLQQPTSFFYPRLPHIQFFENEDFAWLTALTDAVPAMTAELTKVVASDQGLTPYVSGSADRPNRGHALLGDPRWSAFHLWNDGTLNTANAERCPATIAALAAAPIPFIDGRSPMALFSVLDARTHIPPHTGLLNTRLICHIPLIVPENCRLRVGNETRAVAAGVPMIFDDSIEHEAWNDSDELRVVLLFEIWRPELTGDERAALTELFEAIGGYPS